jgi:hypothetical protein
MCTIYITTSNIRTQRTIPQTIPSHNKKGCQLRYDRNTENEKSTNTNQFILNSNYNDYTGAYIYFVNQKDNECSMEIFLFVHHISHTPFNLHHGAREDVKQHGRSG